MQLSIHQRILPYYARGWGTNQIAGATGLRPDDIRKAAGAIGRMYPHIKARHDACRANLGSRIIWPNAKIVIEEAERFCEI